MCVFTMSVRQALPKYFYRFFGHNMETHLALVCPTWLHILRPPGHNDAKDSESDLVDRLEKRLEGRKAVKPAGSTPL